MSGEAKAAIAETAARAKQLLFRPDGKLMGDDQLASLWTMQRMFDAQAGSLFFDWHGKTHVYRKDVADALLADADRDAFIDGCCVVLKRLFWMPFTAYPTRSLGRTSAAGLWVGLRPRRADGPLRSSARSSCSCLRARRGCSESVKTKHIRQPAVP